VATANKKFLRRRNFLSRTAAVGGMAMLGASAGSAQAANKLTKDISGATPESKGLWQGNATVDDFSGLVGKRFSMRTEDGITSHATLIDASSPKNRRAPRFRREHFSIVFDVPRDVDLVQGLYRVSHSQIGTMDLFMVPVDLPDKFNRLEAIFA
jgi:hypothetical protein